MSLECRDCKEGQNEIKGSAYASDDENAWLCEKHFDREEKMRGAARDSLASARNG